jgi:hypothetical protein
MPKPSDDTAGPTSTSADAVGRGAEVEQLLGKAARGWRHHVAHAAQVAACLGLECAFALFGHRLY